MTLEYWYITKYAYMRTRAKKRRMTYNFNYDQKRRNSSSRNELIWHWTWRDREQPTQAGSTCAGDGCLSQTGSQAVRQAKWEGSSGSIERYPSDHHFEQSQSMTNKHSSRDLGPFFLLICYNNLPSFLPSDIFVLFGYYSRKIMTLSGRWFFIVGWAARPTPSIGINEPRG